MKLIDEALKKRDKDVIDYIINHKCPSDYGWTNHQFCGQGTNCYECWNQKLEVKND
jgi:hypothetical protein